MEVSPNYIFLGLIGALTFITIFASLIPTITLNAGAFVGWLALFLFSLSVTGLSGGAWIALFVFCLLMTILSLVQAIKTFRFREQKTNGKPYPNTSDELRRAKQINKFEYHREDF